MMWHRCLPIALFLCGFEIKSGETSCLTWCIEGKTLKLICRVDNFSDYISITDPQGKQQAHCDLSMTTPRCISNGSIKTNSSTKEIELVLKNIQSNMINGLWTCSQRHNISSTQVSTENGIILASKVNLFVEELSNPRKMAQFRCNSCREPRGNHVEFLINNVTFDSIIHNRLSGRCTHFHGECKPELCTCSPNGREFTRMIELTTDNLTISCEMSFSDKTKISFFTVIANIHYNGKRFTKMDPTIIVTKKPEGTGSKEEIDGIISDNDKESNENETVTEESTEKDFQLTFIAVSSLITALVLSIVFGIIIYCILRKYKNERRTTENNYEKPRDHYGLYEEINTQDDQAIEGTEKNTEPVIKNEQTTIMNTIETDIKNEDGCNTITEAVIVEKSPQLILNQSYKCIAGACIVEEVTDEKESTSVKSGSSYENVLEDEGQTPLVNRTPHENGDLQYDEDFTLTENRPIADTSDENDKNKDDVDKLKLVFSCICNIHQEESFRIGSITTTSNGLLLVCEMDNTRVFKFDKDFAYIKSIETVHQPYDLAVIPDSNRAVTTCHHVPFIQMLDIERSKVFETKLVKKDIVDSGIFCTNLYVIVGGRRQIYLYSHEISLEKTIAINGSEGVIRSLCCTNEIVCLIEQGSSTVQFVTLFGENENSYHPKYFNLPTTAVVGKNNDIFILERAASKIHHLSARGEFVQVIDPVNYDLKLPMTICFSRDYTKLYVSNESGSSIVEFNVVY